MQTYKLVKATKKNTAKNLNFSLSGNSFELDTQINAIRHLITVTTKHHLSPEGQQATTAAIVDELERIGLNAEHLELNYLVSELVNLGQYSINAGWYTGRGGLAYTTPLAIVAVGINQDKNAIRQAIAQAEQVPQDSVGVLILDNCQLDIVAGDKTEVSRKKNRVIRRY